MTFAKIEKARISAAKDYALNSIPNNWMHITSGFTRPGDQFYFPPLGQWMPTIVHLRSHVSCFMAVIRRDQSGNE